MSRPDAPAPGPLPPLDHSRWSGEGALTQVVLDRLSQVDAIDFVRVEDAPATRAEANYAFVSNEIYVSFGRRERLERRRRFGILPATRRVAEPAMSLVDLERLLMETPGIGTPDYADETMLQYLRTERIVPPYQTRGYKQVELVRIYAVAVN